MNENSLSDKRFLSTTARKNKGGGGWWISPAAGKRCESGSRSLDVPQQERVLDFLVGWCLRLGHRSGRAVLNILQLASMCRATIGSMTPAPAVVAAMRSVAECVRIMASDCMLRSQSRARVAQPLT